MTQIRISSCGLSRNRVARRRLAAGTTLVEVALCVCIVGVGIAAIMQFMSSGTRANSVTTQLSLAVQAARVGWESTRLQPFATVQGWQTTPPAAASLPGGMQRVIQVQGVDLNSVATMNPATPSPGVLRVVVLIQKGNALVYSQSWILARPGGA